MKVADKSAGKLQPARTSEDPRDLHERFSRKKWKVPETKIRHGIMYIHH
jgi:hypothetical protein